MFAIINGQCFPESAVSDHRTSARQSRLCSEGQRRPSGLPTTAVGVLATGRPSGMPFTRSLQSRRPPCSVGPTEGAALGPWACTAGRRTVRGGRGVRSGEALELPGAGQGGPAPPTAPGTLGAVPGLERLALCPGHCTSGLPGALPPGWGHGVQRGVTRWPPSPCGHSAVSKWRGDGERYTAHGKAHPHPHALQGWTCAKGQGPRSWGLADVRTVLRARHQVGHHRGGHHPSGVITIQAPGLETRAGGG